MLIQNLLTYSRIPLIHDLMTSHAYFLLNLSRKLKIMKRILLTVAYWSVSVLTIALMLMSLGYCFEDALFISMSFVPGCLVLRWLLPHVSFRNMKKGIVNMLFVIAAVLLTDMLLVIWCHVMMNGLLVSYHEGFPTILVNPAFLALMMAVLTGGDYILSLYLKDRYKDEPHPVTFTSDYRKVTLDLAEILYVESRDTEVWVYAIEERHFRNKTGITQWEKLLGEDFIRVHRSYVVRRSFIAEVSSDSLTLSDGTAIPVSRKYRDLVSALQ